MLIALAGLPGAGKTTLARGLARQFGAAYVRVDTIEQALLDAHLVDGDAGVTGYRIAYALAEDQLRAQLTVIADSVNPVRDTRQAWREVALRAGHRCVDVEVVCSDEAEHRRRVENRAIDVPGLVRPTWHDVTGRSYEPWDGSQFVIDTAHATVGASLDQLRRMLAS